MNGFPQTKDLMPIIGSEITQIGIGANDLIFNFHNNNYISCYGSVKIDGKIIDDEIRLSIIKNLNGATILKIDSTPRTMSITTTKGAIELVDDSEYYESFSIKIGENLYIV